MSSEALMALSEPQQEPGILLAVPIAHIRWAHNLGRKPKVVAAVDTAQD